MGEKKLQCLECQKRVANTPNVLARHLRTLHGIEWVDYVVKYECGGKWPTCACGCGERLTWKKGGFGKYAHGHDNRGQQNSRASVSFDGPGWIMNPFTGREEHIGFDDEVAFLEHCVKSGDAVTHDHGIRIGWEDASGKLKVTVPSFKHLQKKLLLTIESPAIPGFDQRLIGLRTWCDEHSYMLLVLRRDEDGGFSVIAGHRGKGTSNAKGQSEVPD